MRALVMSLYGLNRCPRGARMVELLARSGFRVDLASYERFRGSGIDRQFLIVRPSVCASSRFKRYLRMLVVSMIIRIFPESAKLVGWEVERRFGLERFEIPVPAYDLIVVEDWALLSTAFRLKNAALIICDAREYYPRECDNSLLFRIFSAPARKAFCSHFLKRCDLVLTVSEGLATLYKTEFGVQSEVVMSTPWWTSSCPKVRRADPHIIRMVHHGVANRDRKLEDLMAIAKGLGVGFTLDLYLTGGDNVYLRNLKRKSEDIDNVHVRDAVLPEQIISTLTEYDLYLCFFSPTSTNLTYCLPNKLFEAIHAKLVVVSGPSPCIAKLLRQYRCGFVTKDFSVTAAIELISALTANDILEARQSCDTVARQLCFDNEGKKISEWLLKTGRPA